MSLIPLLYIKQNYRENQKPLLFDLSHGDESLLFDLSHGGEDHETSTLISFHHLRRRTLSSSLMKHTKIRFSNDAISVWFLFKIEIRVFDWKFGNFLFLGFSLWNLEILICCFSYNRFEFVLLSKSKRESIIKITKKESQEASFTELGLRKKTSLWPFFLVCILNLWCS